jgi:nifR3 family TIM-barrel protein
MRRFHFHAVHLIARPDEKTPMIQLKNHVTVGDLVLAPMAGITDSPFRRIARRCGAGFVFSELVSAEGILRKNRKALDLLTFTGEERPIGIQLFGRNPAALAEAAKLAEELGPDLIDINMGCCAPKVCSNGSGAALLMDPALAGAIASEVVKSVSLPVSAKIRIGWDDSSKNYMDVIRRLEDAGLAFISVHGRTRSQKYSGSADWNIIEEIARSASVPVIGNGDICTHDAAMERLRTSGCRAVMIGRGAMGNPWIFNGAAPSMQEVIAMIRVHLELMTGQYGEYGTILMRKHLSKYIHGVRNAARVRSALMTAVGADEILSIIDTLADLPLEHSA